MKALDSYIPDLNLRWHLSKLRSRPPILNIRSRIPNLDLRGYLFGLSLRSWGKITFWLISAIPTVFIFIVVLSSLGYVDISALPTETDIFSDALPILVNMIGFLFIILIFVIQNTAQEYNPDLYKEIYKDRYFVIIFGAILLIAIYNLFGSYLELGKELQSIGFVLTVSSFLYLISLSLITGYYLTVSNIIKRTGARTQRKITKDNIHRSATPFPLKDEDFLDELTQDTLLITNTAIKAIENNNHVLVVACIKSLEEVGVTYLKAVDSPTQDDFVRELNDQYEFIIQRTGRDYTSQKYLNPLCESIGRLSRETYRNTGNATQTSMWLKSLKEIFEITYPEMDRTEALGTSIKEINRTTVLALESKSHNAHTNYWQFSATLKDIGKWSLQNGASMPLRLCLSQFQWHYISMINSIISERLYYESYQLEKPLDEITELYTAAWKSDYFDKGLLEAVFFRLESLPTLFRYYGLYSMTPNQAAAIGSLTTSPPNEMTIEPRNEVTFENARLESEFIECCEVLVDFIGNIAKLNPGTNYHDIYSAYAELLFIFGFDINTEFVDKKDLIDTLTTDYFRYMLKELESSDNNRPDLTVMRGIGDYLIISIFLYRQNDERLSDILEEVISFYGRVKNRSEENRHQWMYRYLKLCGCLINQYDGLKKSQQKVEEVLIRDYYVIPEYPGKAIRPQHQRLGYPSGQSHGVKKLGPKQTWGNLQQIINNEFYDDFGEQSHSYHISLKVEVAKRNAKSLSGIIDESEKQLSDR